MKINQLKTGVILSYASQAVNILTGLLYTPIMLRLLGQSEYGLYQLVYSVVSYLGLLSLGFSASYVKFYSRYTADNNKDGVARLNGMFMTIFIIIALVCLTCGIVMFYNAESVFGNGLTLQELSKAKILLAVMVFNMALTFIGSVFSSIVTAHEKFVFLQILNLIRAVFNPLLTLPLLILGYGSVAMVLVTTLLTILGLLANIFFCIRKLCIKFKFSKFDNSLFKEMWNFTFFIFLGMIVDQLNWSVDKFLLGRMIGTGAVAVYGVAAQLNSLYLSLSTSVSSVFIPRVNMIVAKNNDNRELTSLLTKVGRIQFLILGLIITGFIIFGKEFIYLWAGENYSDAYIVGLFLMVPVTVPLVQNLGIEIQRAKNMHKVRSVVYVIMAIANIFVSIPLIKHLGVIGASAGTALSLTIGNILFMNWYYHNRMKLDMVYFWKSLQKPLVLTALVALIGVFLKKVLLIYGNILSLMFAILLYSLIYVVILWFFGMNQDEKNLVIKPLENVRNKLCRK